MFSGKYSEIISPALGLHFLISAIMLLDSLICDSWIKFLKFLFFLFGSNLIREFKEHFEILLSDAITFTGNNKEQVFVVSIPDWGVMPFSKNLNKEKIAKEIDDFNQVIYEVCVFKGVHFVDITPISRSAKNRKDFIAKDSLHPSGIQYKAWVQKIIPLFQN